MPYRLLYVFSHRVATILSGVALFPRSSCNAAYATLPETTATGERTFNALKYSKTYLWTTMGKERLNGLTCMYINRTVKLQKSH